MPRVLFLPSHVGLGHVARDYAVSIVLRRLVPGVELDWCSAEPVNSFLDALGERVVPDCRRLESFSSVIEDLYNGRIRGLRELGSRLGVLRRNWEIVRDVLEGGGYDLVFADEFWEVVYAAPAETKKRIVFGTDILYKRYSLNPLDSFISFVLNRYFKRVLPGFGSLIFLNDPETLGDARWYPLLGRRVRDWVKEHMFVTGLVTSFAPGEVPARCVAREKLGIGCDEFLVVVSVGGTSTRSEALLSYIDKAAEYIAHKLRESLGKQIRIIALPGPRTKWESKSGYIDVHKGIIPRLLNYYAAADAFITRAGRTTTADLLCLGKPAVLIPIKGHFEQEDIARDLNNRYGYLVLRENECNAEKLAAGLLKAMRKRYMASRELCMGVEKTARFLAKQIEAI